MAHATEIKQHVARAPSLVVTEIAVEVTYSQATLAKGQSTSGALHIVRDLAYAYQFGDRT